VQAAWASGRKALARTEAGRTALAGAEAGRTTPARTEAGRAAPAGATGAGYPLPGLPELFSAVAGAPIVPETLLADVVGAIVARLTGP
jgi:hypothetical protein